MKTARATGLAAVIVVVLSSARADWRFEAETGALYDSNLSNSDRASDVEDDLAWVSELRAVNGLQLSRDLRLSLGGNLHGEVWNQYNAFNHITLSGSAGLRYRFGLGRRAPWIAVEDNPGYAFFNESRRSGLDNQFRVRAGAGITERLSVETAYTFDEFQARDRFFDVSGHSGAIRLIVDATSSLQLALGYRYRDGVVISYAIPPRPDILAITTDRRPVSSFGAPPYTAYRFRASTHAISASAGYTFGKRFSGQIAYEFQETSRNALEYEIHLVEARLVFAY
jgi:hypothetical protein